MIEDRIRYDPLTGEFHWKQRPRGMTRAAPGAQAGTIGFHGYRVITIDGKKMKAARIAFFLTHGRWPVEVDHINGNRADDRLENLREATRSQNVMNRRPKKNVTGMRGVSPFKRDNKFQTKIMVDGKSHWLGLFDTPEEASAAYEAALKIHHGKFARAA